MRPLSPLHIPHSDALADIQAALSGNPFQCPVKFRGRDMPRADARELERTLIAHRRGLLGEVA